MLSRSSALWLATSNGTWLPPLRAQGVRLVTTQLASCFAQPSQSTWEFRRGSTTRALRSTVRCWTPASL